MTMILLVLMPVNFCMGFWLAMSLGLGPASFADVKQYLLGAKGKAASDEIAEHDEAGKANAGSPT